MTRPRVRIGETMLVIALTAACLYTAGAVLQVAWLSQPWRYLWACVSLLWN